MQFGYVFKWPEEGVWLTLGTLLAALAVALFDEVIHWPRGVEIAVVALIIPGFRTIGGLVIPTPTVSEAVRSVREAIDDKPGG